VDDKYILEGKNIVEADLMTWAKWMETADRKVKKTELQDVEISTVFLGLDHSFGNGTPLLFETLVFGGLLDGEMERYPTWEEAEVGHEAMVERVKVKLPSKNPLKIPTNEGESPSKVE